MKKPHVVLSLIALVAVAVAVSFSYQSPQPSASAEALAEEAMEAAKPLDEAVMPPEAPTPAPSEETVPAEDASVTADAPSAAQQIAIAASNFKFSLASIAVKKGNHVRITLTNNQGFHDLKIDEFGVATKKLGAGQADTVEFVADKTGTFEYYCSVGAHRAMGMKGTLTVTE